MIFQKQITCVGADDGHTMRSGFIDLTPANTPLSIEMEVRPFYLVCLTPDESSRMVGTTCSGKPVLISRLSVTMRYDHME